MTGHECWMAGASEIVYSCLMMQNGFIAPNINFENPDEDSAKLNIIKTSKHAGYKCIFVQFVWLRRNEFIPDRTKMVIRRYEKIEEIIGKINGFLVEEFEVEASKIKPEANLKEVLELGQP